MSNKKPTADAVLKKARALHASDSNDSFCPYQALIWNYLDYLITTLSKQHGLWISAMRTSFHPETGRFITHGWEDFQWCKPVLQIRVDLHNEIENMKDELRHARDPDSVRKRNKQKIADKLRSVVEKGMDHAVVCPQPYEEDGEKYENRLIWIGGCDMLKNEDLNLNGLHALLKENKAFVLSGDADALEALAQHYEGYGLDVLGAAVQLGERIRSQATHA